MKRIVLRLFLAIAFSAMVFSVYSLQNWYRFDDPYIVGESPLDSVFRWIALPGSIVGQYMATSGPFGPVSVYTFDRRVFAVAQVLSNSLLYGLAFWGFAFWLRPRLHAADERDDAA